MKKMNLLPVFAAIFAVACSNFTELEPKGKNLLSTTTQLEMLLNEEYETMTTDMKAIAGDLVPATQNIPTLLGLPNKTREVLLITFDDAQMDLLASLTPRDPDCDNYYGYIGRIANPILMKIDRAEGDARDRDRLKCEALVLRAYFHYILVNKYAKAYHPGTAADDPGIPYMTEDADIAEPTRKVSVARVYELILQDLDEAIRIDALPETAVNRMRVCKPCAYAVKALVLMSMQRYDEAAEAARAALAIRSDIDDYNTMLSTLGGQLLNTVFTRPQLQCQEDLFFTLGQEGYPISTEAWDAFEAGSICRDKLLTFDVAMMGMMTSAMMLGVPYQMVMDMYSGWNGAGVKTTHMVLVLAECCLRDGDIDGAMEYLDRIRANRILSEVYQPLAGQVSTMEEAVRHLKQTSHGEHIFSIWNFIHRKRWNQTDWKETFVRNINGTVYTLSPESKLWVFPFPQNVVNNNPGMTHN